MDHRVAALLAEPLQSSSDSHTLVVAQPSLGPLDGEVDDQPVWRYVPQLGANALVERGVDRNVWWNAYVRVTISISIRIIFGLISSTVWLTLSSGP